MTDHQRALLREAFAMIARQARYAKDQAASCDVATALRLAREIRDMLHEMVETLEASS